MLNLTRQIFSSSYLWSTLLAPKVLNSSLDNLLNNPINEDPAALLNKCPTFYDSTQKGNKKLTAFLTL